jgi:hypothetical protein
MKMKPLQVYIDRFMSHVHPEPNTGCWLWDGSHGGKGYGVFRFPKNGVNKMQNAHRIAYEIERGPIPKGLCLDHLCRNPACVNPDHLEIVTYSENINRGESPEASRQRWLGNQLRKGKHWRHCNKE